MCPFEGTRYYALYLYYRKRYAEKVMKASLDAGMTCPNLDGSKGVGGCIFCDNGSGYFVQPGSITHQLEAEAARIHTKYPEAKLIAYFQAHTNTYTTPDVLHANFTEACAFPGVVGLAVGTRADCLPPAILDELEAWSHRTDLTVELGLQTIHPETTQLLNRQETYEDFCSGLEALQKRGIRTCVHIINGLPGETPEMMLETAKVLGKLHPDGIKIQMLHVMQDTVLAEWYRAGRVPILSMEDYIELVIQQLEYLPPETVIERLTGDGIRARLIEPLWSLEKSQVLNTIAKRQKELDSSQGKRYQP